MTFPIKRVNGMNWSDYVAFTATTALPGTDDPNYLRLGILEEAHEALAAYATWQAAIHGRAKRVLRGDPPHVLQAKADATEIARRQLVEEIGDLAWYVARLGSDEPSPVYSANLIDVCMDLLDFADEPSEADAVALLSRLLTLSGVELSTVLDINVAKLTARKSAGTIKGEGSR